MSLNRSTQRQSKPVCLSVDLMDASTGTAYPDTQQQPAAVDGSVLLVEPADFLLGSVQPLSVLAATDDRRTAATETEDVTVSSLLLEAELVQQN